jgi:hypothetical protein
MKTLLRCGYVALIASSVAIQSTAGRRSNADSDPMATLAAGLERLDVQADRSMTTDILTGYSPSCEQPIHVMLLRIDGAQDERVSDLGPADETARYVYLGSVSEKRNEAVVLSRWLLARARFIVGLSAIDPRYSLVLVLLPRTCPGLGTLEWATLSPWD